SEGSTASASSISTIATWYGTIWSLPSFAPTTASRQAVQRAGPFRTAARSAGRPLEHQRQEPPATTEGVGGAPQSGREVSAGEPRAQGSGSPRHGGRRP